MSKREYRGDPIDATYQSITERPALEDQDTDGGGDPDSDVDDQDRDRDTDQSDAVVYATDPEPAGEVTTTDVPILSDDNQDDEQQRPLVPGQTTLVEWA